MKKTTTKIIIAIQNLLYLSKTNYTKSQPQKKWLKLQFRIFPALFYKTLEWQHRERARQVKERLLKEQVLIGRAACQSLTALCGLTGSRC